MTNPTPGHESRHLTSMATFTVWSASDLVANPNPSRVRTAPAVAPCSRNPPSWLADRIITTYTTADDQVVIPDCGDGTMLAAAARRQRHAYGFAFRPAHAARIHARISWDVSPARRHYVHLVAPRAKPNSPPRNTSLVVGLVPCGLPHAPCARPSAFSTHIATFTRIAHRVIANDGAFLLVIRDTPHPGEAFDRIGSAIAAVVSARPFTYRQHLAAIHRYRQPQPDLHQRPVESARQPTRLDLLAFTPTR